MEDRGGEGKMGGERRRDGGKGGGEGRKKGKRKGRGGEGGRGWPAPLSQISGSAPVNDQFASG